MSSIIFSTCFVLTASHKGFGRPSRSPRRKHADDGSPQPQPLGDLPAPLEQQSKAVVLRENSQQLRNAISSMEKDHDKRRNRKLNINKDVAARGKVDFVKVESWGEAGTDESELDNLKVKAFSPAFSSTDKQIRFYERLVHHLQLLESKGDILIVQAQSLPHFQNWVFGKERYLQYLIDQHAVFDALRFCVSSIERLIATDSDNLEKQDPEHLKAARALKIFNEDLGLDRSEALQNDITALAGAMTSASGKDIEFPKPTTQTTAYVKYLRQLARNACNENDGKQACLRILAHIFTLYVTHLTTGMRIGAKALDCLPILKQARGVSFYHDYPKHVTDPLKIFIASINKIVEFVSIPEDQELVMEELPKAIQKTSLLLVVLAVEEQKLKFN